MISSVLCRESDHQRTRYIMKMACVEKVMSVKTEASITGFCMNGLDTASHVYVCSDVNVSVLEILYCAAR